MSAVLRPETKGSRLEAGGLLLVFGFLLSLQHVRIWYEPQSGFWDEQFIIKQHLQWHRLVFLNQVQMPMDH